jgi:hypothetical protein
MTTDKPSEPSVEGLMALVAQYGVACAFNHPDDAIQALSIVRAYASRLAAQPAQPDANFHLAASDAGRTDGSEGRDAARYRLLRNCRGQAHDPFVVQDMDTDEVLWGDDLDSAIDDAANQDATFTPEELRQLNTEVYPGELVEIDWHDPDLCGPAEGWHNNPRADFLHDALAEIAETKSLTATPAQFYQYLQRLACKALTADARAEPADSLAAPSACTAPAQEPGTNGIESASVSLPAQPQGESLANMVSRITPENRHGLAFEDVAQPHGEPVAEFDDPRVQLVHAILCDDNDYPPTEPLKQQHWEGWVARRIVDRLFTAPQQSDRALLEQALTVLRSDPCRMKDGDGEDEVSARRESIIAALRARLEQGEKING